MKELPIQKENISLSEIEFTTVNEKVYSLIIPSDSIVEKEFIQQKTETIYHTLGGMSMSTEYIEHLEAVEVKTVEAFDEQGRLIPEEFSAVAFPNPTNGPTTLKFEVPKSSKVVFAQYSMDGRMISMIDQQEYEPGTHEIPFDFTNEEPGTYIIVVRSENYSESVRVMKL